MWDDGDLDGGKWSRGPLPHLSHCLQEPYKCQGLHCGSKIRWIDNNHIFYDPLDNKELLVKELIPKFDSIKH